MAIKQINEQFFDEESEAMNYVRAAFYAGGYIIKETNDIIFRSRQKDLVEIVKREWESEHVIISDPRGKRSYWVHVKDVSHLCDKLRDLSLGLPKKERTFPFDIDEEYLSHFVRGFLDAQAGVCNVHHGKLTNIEIEFNHEFLSGLHQTLKAYAGVERDEPSKDRLCYGHKDSLKIHDFIYGDWDFIEEHGLYLPSKKEVYILDYPGNGSINPRKIAAAQKVEKAKELLLQGLKVIQIYEEVGYSYPPGLYPAFKKETSLTPGQFKIIHKIEKAKELLLQGLPISQVFKQVGYSSRTGFYGTFKKVTGKTPMEFVRTHEYEKSQ